MTKKFLNRTFKRYYKTKMNTNVNYDLPPIRKVGPAVLPKPKNIKIQAGRGTSF